MQASVCRPWYLWEVPGKQVSVRLGVEAMRGLRTAAMKGFPSRHARGEEMGGLLLGRTSRNGRQTLVEIEDFEPVRCEHAFGPSLLFSPEDRRAFEEQLSWRRSVKNAGEVVGFWRSNTRKTFELAVEDADLFALHFSRPSDVFLLIRTSESGPSGAGFVIWEGGRIRSKQPYLEFPFDPEAVAASAPSEKQARPPVSAEEPVSDPPPEIAPSAARWRAPFHRGPLLWVFAGFAALLLALVVGNLRRTVLKQPEHEGGLALRVSPQASGLRLDWDRNAPAIRTARKGILWIHDGARSKRIELQVAQLTDGGVAYWPQSSDVAFRLEVFSGSGITAESLRAVAAPPPGSATTPAPDTPLSATDGLATRAELSAEAPLPDSVLERMYQARQAQALSRAGKISADRDAEPPEPKPRTLRPFAPPPAPAQPAPLAPEPPQIASVKPTASKLSTVWPLNAPIPEPAQPYDSSLTISTEYVDDEPHGRFGGRRKIPDFSPPTLVRDSPPQIPSALRSRIRREVAIDVKLYVNETGGVDYTELFSDHAKRNRDLEALAVFAARKWKFTPARIAGRNAPSEVILHFRFAPSASASAGLERANSDPRP